MNSFVKGLALLCLLSNAVSVFSQKLKEEEINVLIERINSREVNDTLKAVALGTLIADAKSNKRRSADYVEQLYALTGNVANPKDFAGYFAWTSDNYNLGGKYEDALSCAWIAALIVKKYGTREQYLSAVDKVCLSLLQLKSIDELLALSSST
ncbi:MAG: hypothetical protein M0D53_01350 [Flavobacterium sp. JAD_PAG50586_2]|nr:MAG: hypothetical protein M0D53_01350 [Flavobacterium sp. JAD_PAG50586_2]